MDQQQWRLSIMLVVFMQLFLRKTYGYNAEGNALIAFKTNLKDFDNVLRSWDSLEDVCGWLHITCNRENNVVMVGLSRGNLSGQLVPELGQLTSLQFLDLSGNDLTGTIPDELGNLTHLTTLDLSFNRLNGEIPNSLGKLRMLQHLFLNNNTLTGSVPVSLTAIISKLAMFNISNNNLSGNILLNGSFSNIPSSSFAGNPNLRVRAYHEAPMIPRSHSHSVTDRTTIAIEIGVSLGVCLLGVGLATAFIWYCCRN